MNRNKFFSVVAKLSTNLTFLLLCGICFGVLTIIALSFFAEPFNIIVSCVSAIFGSIALFLYSKEEDAVRCPYCGKRMKIENSRRAYRDGTFFCCKEHGNIHIRDIWDKMTLEEQEIKLENILSKLSRKYDKF